MASILGTAGDDLILGTAEADTLDGTSGNDSIDGGEGDDTYLFGLGDGQDLIFATDTGIGAAGKLNTLRFKAGVDPSHVIATRHAAHLTLSLGDSTDQVDIEYVFSGDWQRHNEIQQVVFDDGTRWDLVTLERLAASATLAGTAGDDTLQGTTASSFLDGGAGDDLLRGLHDYDFLHGGAGHDTLEAGQGFSLMHGGTGDDTYVLGSSSWNSAVIELADEGIDTLVSVADIYRLPDHVENAVLLDSGLAGDLHGNDLDNLLTGNASGNDITGEAGNDTLIGGRGADRLTGGGGDDTVVIGRGSGQDTICADIDAREQRLDTLRFADGILPADLSARRDGTALVLWITGTTDQVVIESFWLDGAADNPANPVRQVVFGNGVRWHLTDLIDLAEATPITGQAGSDTLTGTPDNDRIDGLAGNDTLVGLAGSDTLDGGTGNDRLRGGPGDDTYLVDTTGDSVEESPGEGLDQVVAPLSYTLGANIEHLVLSGSGALNGTGNAGSNRLVGQDGNNRLDGLAGDDTMLGGAGNDTLVANSAGDIVIELPDQGIDLVESSVAFTLGANVEHLTLTGTGAINATGNALDNRLTGNGAANRLDGGNGIDTLAGGAGDDTYVVDDGDETLVELAAQGTDQVLSSFSLTLPAHIEHLTLTGLRPITATGNTLANRLVGNSADNELDGQAGNDTMLGGFGDDTYVIDTSGDSVIELTGEGTDLIRSSITWTLPAEVENLTLTGTAAINATGNALDNTLTGNAGNNLLNGAAGNDTLAGGSGNDTYVVDAIGDVVIEAPAQGTDLVQSAVSFTLGADIENLTLTGIAAIDATGNALANVLTGNGGANVLDGGAGLDTLVGGAGDDTYVVDAAGEKITELAGQGTDQVLSSRSLTLPANVEHLTLTGDQAISGTGNTLANRLTGNAGDNLLDGQAGADTLVGGLGDDRYVVDVVGDSIVERADEGIDTVLASVSYTAPAEVENLTLTGSAALNAAGNTLGNVLTGNAGANVLDGKAGADTLAGGAGNDTYVVDSADDVVVESANAGTDLIQAAVSFTAPANVENLTLTGTAAIDATGNALANVLVGNAGHNGLDGGAGADKMSGGAGDDVYRVDNAGDTVTEAAGQGEDRVLSSISLTLGNFVEHLTLVGSAALNATGNTLANVLAGNDAANVLDGKSGNDTLAGGAGNDTYVLGRGSGTDRISEDDATAGNTDVLLLQSGIAPEQLWFRRLGDDLEVAIIGTADKATVVGWYQDGSHHVEQIRTATGKVLLDAAVDALVGAMAAFSPPASGQTTLPTNYGKVLAPVIAANWH